jgi:opacity protein-like surface antigen
MGVSSGLRHRFLFITVFNLFLLLSTTAFAHDEVVYFSGQVGKIFSAKLSDINNVGGSYEAGTTATDLDLKNSSMYGAKLGIYSKRGILALETEIFQSKPDAEKQLQTFNEPSFGPFVDNQANTVKITTWAVNVIARFPVSERLVLYAGAGPAYYRGRFQDSIDIPRGGVQRSNKLGFGTQVGVNYFVTPNVGLSAEWKYNHARFKIPNDANEHGLNASFNSHTLAAGIGYYFDVPLPWKMSWTLREVFGMPARQQPGGKVPTPAN